MELKFKQKGLFNLREVRVINEEKRTLYDIESKSDKFFSANYEIIIRHSDSGIELMRMESNENTHIFYERGQEVFKAYSQPNKGEKDLVFDGKNIEIKSSGSITTENIILIEGREVAKINRNFFGLTASVQDQSYELLIVALVALLMVLSVGANDFPTD